jgi:sugar lactone lactonase YvrE
MRGLYDADMKRPLIAVAVLLAATLSWLLLAPTPVDPIAWQPPADAGLVGDFAPNDDLAGVSVIALPDGHGPEDVEVDAAGRIYAGLQDGRILRWSTPEAAPEVFADTGGRPLGLHWDGAGNLLVADAFAGLLSISPDGAITTLLTGVDGQAMVFTDDLEITGDGVIYVSDASVRFDQHHWKLDIIESRPSGRLIAYDTATGVGSVALDGLYFANGVAVDPQGRFVLVVETSRYRVRRLWIAGERAGSDEVIIDNLPGFPDGISTGTGGVFWLALPGPRNPLIDGTAGSPLIRKIMTRLPEALQPAPERYGHVVGIDAEGRVRCSLQHPSGERFAIITSAQERDGWLYLGSLSEPALARIRVPPCSSGR